MQSGSDGWGGNRGGGGGGGRRQDNRNTNDDERGRGSNDPPPPRGGGGGDGYGSSAGRVAPYAGGRRRAIGVSVDEFASAPLPPNYFASVLRDFEAEHDSMTRTRDTTLTGVARRNGSMLEVRERSPSADWYGMIDPLVDLIPNPASVIRGAANNLAAPIRYYWARGPDGEMVRRFVGTTVRAVGTGLRAADRITYRIGDTAVNLTLATAGLGAGAVRAATEGMRARRLQAEDNALQRAFAEAERQSELEEAYFQAMAQATWFAKATAGKFINWAWRSQISSKSNCG